MASSSHSFFPILLLSAFLLSPPLQLQALPQSQCKIPPVIFNFGDSNSDTGGLVAGLGFTVNLPNGRTFFHRSTGRLSDGRLVIDFLCQNVNTSFLSPYMESLGSTFSNGANFAVTIYDQGGRNFWVHNTGPLGCLPQKLSLVQKTSKDLDQHGCLSRYSAAAKLFNEGLHNLCQEMRSELKDATVVYVDIYAIKYDIVANSSKYGFSSPLMACCGFGGPPYNYNIKMACGQAGVQVCNEGSKFVSWDGIHYTEAANTIVASKILSTVYSTPRIAFDFFCH